MKRVVFAGFIWLIAVGPGAQSLLPQTTSDWRPIGPPGAEVLSAAISPDDPEHFFIVVADPIRDSALYETKDGGRSWRLVDIGNGPSLGVVWAEDAARSIYVIQQDGLLRSRDDGTNWQALPIGIPGWVLGSNSRLAFAPPPRSETIWIAGAGKRYYPNPAILESTSGGETWTVRDLPGIGGTKDIAFSRENHNLVYVSTTVAIFRSDNAGGTWDIVAPLQSSRILIDPTDENTLYVATDGIQRSRDAGRTWTLLTDRAFVLADRLGPGGLLFAGGYGRILKSADGGGTWLETARPEFGSAVEIAVSSRRILFATDAGIDASDNRGMSWREIRTGLSGHFISDLAVAPSDPSVIYAATESTGLFRTDDGGGVWKRLGSFSSDTLIYRILVEPSDPNCIYVFFFQDTGNHLIVSENGGLSWTQRSITGLTDIFLSPHRRGVLFATGESDDGGRFYRSFDGGATWTTILLSTGSWAWAGGIAQDFIDPAVIYTIIFGGSRDETVLMRSEDTGLTWTPAWAANGRLARFLALDPGSRTQDGRRNSRIYMAGESGLFRSDDEGRTMARIFDSDIGSLIVDPAHADYIYAQDNRFNSLAASYDRGASWTRGEHEQPASGDLRRVTSLGLDPARRVLYAGTRGGGIYANSRIADPFFPPQISRASIEVNRSLALREYIHVLAWTGDPRNPPLAAYQVMVWEIDPASPQPVEDYVFAAEVPASQTGLMRRGVNHKHRYNYRIRAVDMTGRASAWTETVVWPVD